MTAAAKLAPEHLTYEDYLKFPEDGHRYEIIEGEIFVAPAPFTRHQRVSRDLEFILLPHIEQHALGELFDAPVDVVLAYDSVVQPDLVFVAQARLAIITERAVEGAPDLVVEILSPSNADHDRKLKRALYARHGVAHYWLVDPGKKTLEELTLQNGAYQSRAVFTAPQVATTQCFPELPIELAKVFR